jgi:uncharacterized HAD superfamily protein
MSKTELLFLDVDGVLLDFHSSFCKYLLEVHNVSMSQDKVEFYVHAYGEDVSKETKEQNEMMGVYADAFMKSEYFCKLEALIDERSYSQLLKKYTIFLVTNISEKLKKSRMSNLALRNIYYEDIFFAGEEKYDAPNYPSKHEVIQKKAGAASKMIFLDDLSLNCDLVKKEVSEAEVFLLDKPYNQNWLPAGCKRVKSWSEFVSLVL